MKALVFELSLVGDVRGGESVVGTRTTEGFSSTNGAVALVIFSIVTVAVTCIVFMIWTVAVTTVVVTGELLKLVLLPGTSSVIVRTFLFVRGSLVIEIRFPFGYLGESL